MTARDPSRARFQWLEWVLAFAMLVCGLIVIYQTIAEGFFPQPFFFDADDTFRDWFSTAIWAHEKGAYDAWFSVYPPLNFVLLKFMGLPACYEFAPISTVRDCDWLGLAILHLFFVLNAVIASLVFMKVDRKTALPRAFALSAGMPMLFGLERGNIILLCITCVMLGWGPLIRSARWRWTFIGMTVNFKVYLIGAILVQLVRRRWLWVEGSCIAVVIVYLVSYMIFQEGTPTEIVSNLINFAQTFYASEASIFSIWYPSSLGPLHTVLTESAAPAIFLLGEKLVNDIIVSVVVLTTTAQLVSLAALAAAWLRPEAVTPHRLTLLALAFVMITQENPPYALPILFFFVFMERWKGRYVPAAIVLTYLVSLPGEVSLGSGIWLQQFSYIGNRYIVAERTLAIGMFLRPLGLVMITVLFSLDTIAAVIRDIREQGWASRWRFRHDVPFLPWATQPLAPAVRSDRGNAAG